MKKCVVNLSLFVILVSLSACEKAMLSNPGSEKSTGTRGIKNGVNATEPGVGFLSMGCSAVEIGSRCLLTAAHCDVNQVPNSSTPPNYSQFDYYGYGDEIRILRAAGLVPATVALTMGQFENTDLQVIWTSNKKIRGTVVNWSPKQWQAWSSSPSAGTPMSLFGYGNSGPSPVGTASGAGVQRTGSMKFDSFSLGSFPLGGGAIKLTEDSSLAQSGCRGDSGGPVIYNSKVIGIISAGLDITCLNTNYDASNYTKATAFANGNEVWLQNQISNFCVPRVGLNVYVSAAQQYGKVTGGTLVPSASGGSPTNMGEINCGQGNTQCSIPVPQNRSIRIYAYPATGYSFVEWRHSTAAAAGPRCPCADGPQRTDFRCDIDVNNYPLSGDPVNPEMTSCVAHFDSACPQGTTQCGPSCSNTMTDPINCGSCGNFCASNQTCNAGVCGCPLGAQLCGGQCCSSTQQCVNQACVAGCAPGTVSCNGVCKNLMTDPANCGGCGRVCPTNMNCSAGICNCNGNPACGNRCCVGSEICQNNTCVTPCPTGQQFCGGACIDVFSDRNNCGSCGRICGALQICAAGVCLQPN